MYSTLICSIPLESWFRVLCLTKKVLAILIMLIQRQRNIRLFSSVAGWSLTSKHSFFQFLKENWKKLLPCSYWQLLQWLINHISGSDILYSVTSFSLGLCNLGMVLWSTAKVCMQDHTKPLWINTIFMSLPLF